MKKIQEISTTDNIALEADLKLKADTIAATGCADVTVANGKADISSLFSSTNTPLGATIDAKLGPVADALDALNGEVA